MTATQAAIKRVRAIGDYLAMSLDTFLLMFKPPFASRELLLQSWFVARVSISRLREHRYRGVVGELP